MIAIGAMDLSDAKDNTDIMLPPIFVLDKNKLNHKAERGEKGKNSRQLG